MTSNGERRQTSFEEPGRLLQQNPRRYTTLGNNSAHHFQCQPVRRLTCTCGKVLEVEQTIHQSQICQTSVLDCSDLPRHVHQPQISKSHLEEFTELLEKGRMPLPKRLLDFNTSDLVMFIHNMKEPEFLQAEIIRALEKRNEMIRNILWRKSLLKDKKGTFYKSRNVLEITRRLRKAEKQAGLLEEFIGQVKSTLQDYRDKYHHHCLLPEARCMLESTELEIDFNGRSSDVFTCRLAHGINLDFLFHAVKHSETIHGDGKIQWVGRGGTFEFWQHFGYKDIDMKGLRRKFYHWNKS